MRTALNLLTPAIKKSFLLEGVKPAYNDDRQSAFAYESPMRALSTLHIPTS